MPDGQLLGASTVEVGAPCDVSSNLTCRCQVNSVGQHSVCSTAVPGTALYKARDHLACKGCDAAAKRTAGAGGGAQTPFEPVRGSRRGGAAIGWRARRERQSRMRWAGVVHSGGWKTGGNQHGDRGNITAVNEASRSLNGDGSCA